MLSTTLNRPKLKGKYHVEYVNGAGIFLLSERESFVLEGESMFHVVPLLDGNRTVEQILAETSAAIPAQETINALEILRRDGHLAEADPAAPPSVSAFWSEFDIDTRIVPGLLSACPVEIGRVGDVDATPLRQAMQAAGMTVAPVGVAHVVVTDDYQRPELARLNAACLAQRKPVLLVKPVGIRLWIGPLVVPGRTACWQCLETRLRANREVESFISGTSGRPGPYPTAKSRFGLGEMQAHAMAVTQFVKWLITGSSPELESRILVADQASFTFDFHDVVRLPQCAVCGDPAAAVRAGLPVTLGRSDAAREAGAGLRSESAELTYRRLKHHVSPVTGIVNHLEPAFWHAIGPLRSYVAGHNFALKSDKIWFLKDGLRTRSSGKGWTDAQARTSALCEALERYAGVFRDDQPRLRASYRDLGTRAIDPRAAMLFSERQYRERDAWAARNSRFQVVPEAFDEARELSWTPLWSLTQQCVKYLPTSYLYYNFPYGDEPFFCWADSNGAAAGKTMDEAVMQGLFELIERDAVCLWWYNRLRRPAVDLDGVEDERIEQMRTFYARVNREFWVLDLTADFGVSVFVAISRRLSGPTEDIMMGFGAHLDPRIALTRCLTELNQFIPALLDVGPDGRTRYTLGDHETIAWWTEATLANQPYLRPARRGAPTRIAPPEGVPLDDAERILRHVLAVLEGAGHEVLVLDQSRPDVDLRVVKMVVPGLRHFWARFAPGRLYDVPVRMGWRKEPVAEADLNPVPMFL